MKSRELIGAWRSAWAAANQSRVCRSVYMTKAGAHAGWADQTHTSRPRQNPVRQGRDPGGSRPASARRCGVVSLAAWGHLRPGGTPAAVIPRVVGGGGHGGLRRGDSSGQKMRDNWPYRASFIRQNHQEIPRPAPRSSPTSPRPCRRSAPPTRAWPTPWSHSSPTTPDRSMPPEGLRYARQPGLDDYYGLMTRDYLSAGNGQAHVTASRTRIFGRWLSTRRPASLIPP